MCSFFTVQGQAELQWSAWGNSSWVKDIASDAQYYYVANHFGVTRINKANTSERSYFNKLTTNYNMRDNSAVAVAIDNTGKPIIGANYSFHIQNGSNWQNFRSNTGGVPAFSLSDIFVDTDGSIWVAAQGTGVHKYNGTTWTSYGQNNSTVGTWVNKIFRHQNRLYFATNYNGLAWLEGTTWGSYTTSNSGLPSNSYVRDATFDSSNNLWVISQSGLSKFDGTTWTHFNPTNTPIFSSTQVNCVAFFQGKIYAAPAGQLLSYDGNTWTDLTTNLPEGATGVVTMYVDNAANKLVIGTYKTDIVIYDGSTFTHVPLSNCSLRHLGVSSIGIDLATNIKYMAEDYMNTFNDQQWVNLGYNNNSPSSFSSGGVIKARNGKVFAGTQDGLAVYENNTWQTVKPAGSSFFLVSRVELGINNLVWLTAFNEGLSKYDGTTLTQYNTSNSNIPTNNLGAIKPSPDGSVWIGIPMQKYLYKFDGTNFQKYDSINVSFIPLYNSIGDIAIHPNGKLYVATGGGLGEYDPVARIWKFFNTSNSQIPSNSVNRVLVNPQGDVWISVNSGDQYKIARLRNDEWLVFDDSNCPMDIAPVDMAIDVDGNIWFVGSGVFKLKDPSLPSSTAEKTRASNISVFPNPSHGSFRVKVDKASNFEILDLFGRSCYTFSANIGVHDIETNLPAGQYLLKEIGKPGVQRLLIK
jgi:ligand-binding sensor domain-containing protein